MDLSKRDEGREAEERALLDALASDEQRLGAHHPKVAVHLNSLALWYSQTNRLAEAEQLLRREPPDQ